MLARPGVERGRHVPSPHRIKEMSKEEMEKQTQEAAKCTYEFRVFLLFGVRALRQGMFRGLNALVAHQACPLIWSSLYLQEAMLTRISGQGFRESRRRMRKRKSEDDGTGWVYLARNELSVVRLYSDAAVQVIKSSLTRRFRYHSDIPRLSLRKLLQKELRTVQ